jgi:tetratricopeptide (TPR) repeat protein
MSRKAPILILILLTVAVLVTVFYHTTQQADINYHQAHRFFQYGNYEKAIPYYEASIAAGPEKIDSLKELAYSYLWTGRPEKSIELFKQAIEQKSDDYDIMFALASAYSWAGDYEKAIPILKNVVSKTGGLGAKLHLAEVYIWNAEPEKAMPILEDILKQSPEHTKAKTLWARSLYYTGESEEAAEVLEKLLILDDEDVKKLLAEVYIASDKHEKAIASYKEIIEKEPSNLKARESLAALLSWAGRYDESILQYKYILKANPKDLNTMQSLAQVYTWQGKFKEAEAMYKDTLKTYPDNIEIYLSLGEVLAWQNKYDEALVYFERAIDDTKQVTLLYGTTLLYSGRYDEAKIVFNEILEKHPDDIKAKASLADCYAYTKMYEEAIALYSEALAVKDSIEVKERLADTLSWDKQYDAAIKLYDEILDEKYDSRIQRQKARVLGWARMYDEADREYQKILEKEFDQIIELEMQAKRAYYNSRNRSAIEKYQKLISKEPKNAEAMFDLGQIYSYESMWQGAIDTYKGLLDVYPAHIRAKEALRKTELISEHVSLSTMYDYFKGESTSRETDIKRHQILSSLSVPLDKNIFLGLDYTFTRRMFKDFHNLSENKARVKLDYLARPNWQAGAYYGAMGYHEELDKIRQIFGGNFSYFLDDVRALNLNYDRQALEDNSTVIREYLYKDNFKARMDFDMSRRLKFGADYTMALYSDNNILYEPGADILYYLQLEPKMLFFRYRYFYKEFKEKNKEYWAPKGLSTNTFTINWRHFLNKEEIFFGADNIYYDLRYDFSIDSERVAGNKFTCEFNWDINERLNFNVMGSVMGSSNSVYEEQEARAGFKYYF